MLTATHRSQCIAARRAFQRPGYRSYADVGLDGNYVSPYQLSCGNPSGPVLISYNWLDAPTADTHRDTLARMGYLPQMLFNRVLDLALSLVKMTRNDIYLTHAFHLLPARRSATVPAADVEASFEAITRNEIAGRPVVALGRVATAACARFGIPHRAVSHPSARGLPVRTKAAQIAETLGA